VHASPVAHGKLKAGWSVALTETADGGCTAGSYVIGRAYTCDTTSGLEWTPCWPLGDGSTAVCPQQPWSHKVTLVEGAQTSLAGKLKTSPAKLWGLRLRGGVRCFRINAQVFTKYKGVPMRFGCVGKSWFLVGNPNRSRPIWTIRVVRLDQAGEKPLGQKRITHAYFPLPTPAGS
jgi:hypothetical protein